MKQYMLPSLLFVLTYVVMGILTLLNYVVMAIVTVSPDLYYIAVCDVGH